MPGKGTKPRSSWETESPIRNRKSLQGKVFVFCILYVSPLLEAVVLGHELDAKAQEAQLGGRLQLLAQPLPLLRAEEGGAGVVVGDVLAPNGGYACSR
jgi:hypothetical protein